jgi:hypothetical protein
VSLFRQETHRIRSDWLVQSIELLPYRDAEFTCNAVNLQECWRKRFINCNAINFADFSTRWWLEKQWNGKRSLLRLWSSSWSSTGNHGFRTCVISGKPRSFTRVLDQLVKRHSRAVHLYRQTRFCTGNACRLLLRTTLQRSSTMRSRRTRSTLILTRVLWYLWVEKRTLDDKTRVTRTKRKLTSILNNIWRLRFILST